MAILNFIPLVGSLMSFAVAIAAFIFAFVVGLVLSCLVIAIAWLFYRPLVGASLLLLVGIGIYFIFVFPDGEAASATTQAVSASDSIPGGDPSAIVNDSSLVDS